MTVSIVYFPKYSDVLKQQISITHIVIYKGKWLYSFTDADAKQLVSNDFYSYQHLKAFGIHNHLFADPWNKDSVWFVDEKWHISKVTMATVRMRR